MANVRVIIGVLIAIGVLAGISAGVQAQSDDGLVAEWHFDEGSGSVLKDSSGNGNDGVIYGATWVDGKYGKALSFDGVDDYVEVPHSTSLDITDEITIEAWFRAIDVSGNPFILAHGESFDTDKFQYSLYIESGILKSWFEESDDSDNQVKGSNTLATNKWYQGAVVRTSDGYFILYLNGKVEGSISTNKKPPSISHSLTMGLRTNSPNVYQDYFNGIIDEVRIYNRALTTEEIKEHYEQGPTALSIIKTATPNSIKQGQTTTIILTVKNTGSTEISDIEIADTIPQDLIFIDGETSKTYSSLTPKDSRQFQYVVQLNEAGTYNLNPATATYADEKGNYHTIKSKPAAIEVIPSLVETTGQIQMTAGNDAQTASVHLHSEKTDVVMGEDILLKLAAVNLITKPTMHVQVIITPPSGMSVTSSEFVQSGAGLFTASYEIEPGVGRDIEVRMRSNQIGDFVVNGRIVYYFGDDMDDAEDHTLTLPIMVRAAAAAEADSGPEPEPSTPGFAAVFAVFGLLAVYLRRKV